MYEHSSHYPPLCFRFDFLGDEEKEDLWKEFEAFRKNSRRRGKEKPSTSDGESSSDCSSSRGSRRKGGRRHRSEERRRSRDGDARKRRKY